MEKIKSRWRKNYLEGDILNNDETKDDISDSGGYTNSNDNNYNSNHKNMNSDSLDNKHHHNDNNHHRHHHHSSSKHSAPPTYEPLLENLYLDNRRNEHSRSRKDARSMVCDCILTKEERARGVTGCLDDCLNRMLMIECGQKCTLGDHCLNKRFQKSQSAKVEVFKTKKKGYGLRTTTDLPANSFVMEYVGEVVRSKEFRSRVKKYTKQKIKHHYFMALRSDEIIDATVKGNLTRFINHSCEPNCETQKWTVNGDLRIGFFTIKNLRAGDEVTFDYQFQRYGRKAQKCYCEAPSCRGYIGGNDRTFSLNGNSSSQQNENSKLHKKSYKHGLLLDVTLGDKINSLSEAAAQGLKTKDQVIALASLSIKAEDVNDRRKLLDIIKVTKSEISLRLFVDYHGLEILCLWMRDPQADCEFKACIIDILERLPIPNKTKVLESNVYRMIERWANEELKPNIKALAVKLLKKFQALSPGFKIPRLNRLQRMEMEKKIEEEENDTSNNEKVLLEQKNPFATRNYFKSITCITPTAPTTNKRRFDSNNIDLTPAPKISKEEHRQQFEMHVRLKDYYDTIEKHYGPAAVEQIKLSQRAFPINGLPIQTIASTNPITNTITNSITYTFSNTNNLTPASTNNHIIHNHANNNVAHANNNVTNTNTLTNNHINSSNNITVATTPTIISNNTHEIHTQRVVLANNSVEPAYAIDDELAFSICDYDEYYSIRDKPLSVEDVTDSLYPYPGTYYTTPNGEKWFATVTLDRKTQQARTVILNLASNNNNNFTRADPSR